MFPHKSHTKSESRAHILAQDLRPKGLTESYRESKPRQSKALSQDQHSTESAHKESPTKLEKTKAPKRSAREPSLLFKEYAGERRSPLRGPKKKEKAHGAHTQESAEKKLASVEKRLDEGEVVADKLEEAKGAVDEHGSGEAAAKDKAKSIAKAGAKKATKKGASKAESKLDEKAGEKGVAPKKPGLTKEEKEAELDEATAAVEEKGLEEAVKDGAKAKTKQGVKGGAKKLG